MTRRSLRIAPALLTLALFITCGCKSSAPAGRTACRAASDCPASWFCRSDGFCYDSPEPDGGARDGSVTDAGRDAASDAFVAPDAHVEGDASVVDAGCTSAASCDDGLFCTDDACDTATGVCSHAPHPCAEDTNPCTDGFACDESMDACVPAPAAAGTPCRASVDLCDVAETCDGTSTVCPPDRFADTTVICRGSRGECDQKEACTGTAPTCPADLPADDGTPCELRCGAETCSAGACVGGTSCSARDVCLCDDSFCGRAGTICP